MTFIFDGGYEAQRDFIYDFWANAHRLSLEDAVFAHENYSMTTALFLDNYVEANKMAVVEDPNGMPMYIFAVGPTGFISTLLHERYEGNRIHLTKCLIRFARSDEGQEFFKGTHGAGDVADIENNIFTNGWAERIGFLHCDSVEMYGTTFNRYRFKEF